MTTDKTFVRIVFKNTVLTEVFFMAENTGDTGSEFKVKLRQKLRLNLQMKCNSIENR